MMRQTLHRFHVGLRLLPILSDYIFIRKQFYHTLGYSLNLSEPKTFNEKIQWLKLFWRPELLTSCADKVAVREFVRQRCGASVLNEVYGVYDDPAQIDFAALPNQFVLKTNHSCNQTILCSDKEALDHAATRRQLKKWLNTSHFEHAREWAYKHIRRRILCERYLGNAGVSPPDYKFFCFHGEPLLIQVIVERNIAQRHSYYDPDWNVLDLAMLGSPPGPAIPRPSSLDAMLDCARILSAGFPFVRVDLYEFDGTVIFGELTFYPTGGYRRFDPPEMDLYWGNRLQLPDFT